VSGTDLSLRERFLAGLEREVEQLSGDWKGFDTVYLGGGTPTVLGLPGLGRALRALAPLGIAEGAGWSVEANPDDVSLDLLRGLRDLGVGRLSLGLQSLDDGDLRFLGRRHDAAAGQRAVAVAREAGFEDISVDLIYGLPGQGVESWQGQLRRALELSPTHISAYELTVEPGTPLAATADGLPGEELRRALFVAGSELLRAQGWLHYEVSSFALDGGHRSLHNRKYWSHVPYLGLGPGAHSFDGRQRWWNRASTRGWCEALERGGDPVAERELLSAEQLRLERLALGFRHDGGVAVADLAGHEAAVEQGLLTAGEGRVFPTLEGMLMADGLARRFA